MGGVCVCVSTCEVYHCERGLCVCVDVRVYHYERGLCVSTCEVYHCGRGLCVCVDVRGLSL